MEIVLGLLGVLAWILLTIALAAGVTWTVVKLTPERDKQEAGPHPDPGDA